MAKPTRAERRQRRREKLRNDPSRVTRPLTPKRLTKETEAATKTKFAPVEEQIAGQQRVSDVQHGRIDDWYGEYQRQAQAAEQRTRDLYAQAQADLTARQASAQAADNQSRADLQRAAQEDAASRGATVGDQFAVDQQAAAARRASSDSYGALLASQGATQGAYMADKTRIGAGERASQHVQESGRRRALDKDAEDVAREKGEFRVGYRAEARDKERKYGLERAAFDLDTYEAQERSSSDAADRRDRRRSESGKVNQWGYTNAEWTAKPEAERQAIIRKQRRSGGKGGTSPESPASIRAEKNRVATIHEKSGKALTRIESARSDWESLTGSEGVETGEKDGAGKPILRPIAPKDIRAELRRRGYQEAEIHLMLMLRAGKKWGAREIEQAHRLGIRVPREYMDRPAKRPKHIRDRVTPGAGQ